MRKLLARCFLKEPGPNEGPEGARAHYEPEREALGARRRTSCETEACACGRTVLAFFIEAALHNHPFPVALFTIGKAKGGFNAYTSPLVQLFTIRIEAKLCSAECEGSTIVPEIGVLVRAQYRYSL